MAFCTLFLQREHSKGTRQIALHVHQRKAKHFIANLIVQQEAMENSVFHVEITAKLMKIEKEK